MTRSIRIGLAVISIVLVMACGTDSSPSTGDTPPRPLRQFDGQGVAFDYPAAWSAAQFDVLSSFSGSIVYLSTAPLADPCDRGPNSIACVREAASALGPDGLLVEWSWHGFPGWTFDPTKGRRIDVGGRRATVEEGAASDSCAAIGGERELLVTIDDPLVDQNWTEVRACLRGPDLTASLSQIDAMLRTVRWRS